MSVRTYAAITPVRDEEDNLARLAECMLAQTVRPEAWLIVDNGSSDGTPELARRLTREHDWIRFATAEPADRARPGAPIVRAFNAGVAQLEQRPDMVVKLDADVSMQDDYFERVIGEFNAHPRLGIAGGTCLELRDGNWDEVFVMRGHVRGASRCYRRECLEAVSPLEECVGWDGIDGLKATVLGWETKLLRDVPFRHHRRLGERDGGSTARWRRQGQGSYFMGYRLSYLVLRSLHRGLRDPAAVAMIFGYVAAAVRGEPRCTDPDVRSYIRDQQRLSRVPSRLRASMVRRAA